MKSHSNLLPRVNSFHSLSNSLSFLFSSSSSFTYSLYFLFYILNNFLIEHAVDAVQGCSIFYQSDFKWKKALCDSEVNKLTQLPLDLPSNLIELRVLHQSIMKIKRNSLNHLIHLETFQIESSQLTQIESDTFRQMISLKYINLRNNSLKIGTTSFPVELLHDLPNLRSLNLAENPIDFIPDAFFDNLSGNKLQYLWLGSVKSRGINFESNTLKPLMHLRLLDLSFSGLDSFHASNELALNNMPELKEFYLGGNPWTCDCKLSWLRVWFQQKSLKGLKYQQNKTDQNGNIEVHEPICFKPDTLKGRHLFSANKYNSLQFSDLRCPAQIFTLNQNFTFHFGKMMILRCDYHSEKVDDILWYKDGQFVQNTSEKSITQGQIGSNFYTNLLISSTTGEHTGLWTCMLDDQHRTVFAVSILNSEGKILYPSDENSFMHGAFVLFGASASSNPSSESQTLQETHIKRCSGKSYFVCRGGIRRLRRRKKDGNKNKENKDDSVSSLMVAINDEQKIIDKSELLQGDNQKESSGCILSNLNTLVSDSIATSNVDTVSGDNNNIIPSKRNIEENRLLNIFCCPTNTTREVQVVAIPTIGSPSSSSSTNVTHLGGSLIHETVATGGNRLLVSCDSPEPKLLIANGITPCSNISPLNFSTCLQQTQDMNIGHQQSSTAWNNNVGHPVSELFTAYTPSNQIGLETKPCPVHGVMKLKQVEFMSKNITTTVSTSNCYSSIKQSPNYQTINPVYWSNSNSATFLANPHLTYNMPGCAVFNADVNSTNNGSDTNSSDNLMGRNTEQVLNYSKALLKNDAYNCSLLPKVSLNEPSIQWPSDSLPNESCPLHGYQTLNKRSSKLKNSGDLTSSNDMILKMHQLTKSHVHSQSDHRPYYHHGKERVLHNQEMEVCSFSDNTSGTDEQEETDNQLNSDQDDHRIFSISSNKQGKEVYTSTETESQTESSVSEKCVHSDCASASCTSSSASTTASASSFNQKFKLIHPPNQTGFNSICSSLSNQINLATAAEAIENVQQQSPPSLEFCTSPKLISRPISSNGRPMNYYGKWSDFKGINESAHPNSKCPVHSLKVNRKPISSKIFYDTYNHHLNGYQYSHQQYNDNGYNKNNIGTLRVTTLPSRLRKISSNSITTNNSNYNNMASIRKFASQHTVQSNYSSSLCLSAQSLDKFTRHPKPILRPGSKHKLDTESDSDNNTSEGNNFPL
ncbi:unnamed protein product [Heterobilharzia americana]|nr:unnamed protein product [Heterobilharzia americana]